jgi:hypothetical protein|tara:strand:+ start:1636 stop:2142 length:507 start_codon:yes stop_codon:yes gene_type:complete
MYFFKFIIVVALTSIMTFSSLNAQDFIPAAEANKDGTKGLYTLERCSSLNFAILKWAGESQLNQDGNDIFAELSEEYFALKTTALWIYEQKGFSKSDAANALERNTKMIEEIYLERFKQNYANTGEAFGNDALVLSDREFCKAYVVVAYTQVDFMFGKNWRDMIFTDK